MASILIGGDVCPVGKNQAPFRNGDAEKIFNDLHGEFENADLSIVNLECPLIEKETPIMKNGPVLGADSDCINGLRKVGVDIVNLANNHIMDHGQEGLANTLEICKQAGISTVGAGKNLDVARRWLVRRVGGVRVGILGVAEHEFSIATEDSWGANPLDLIDFVRNVKRHKNRCDYLVVLLHGGNEYYPYPSPRLRQTCRFMVELGANAVIVQHTHCPGCLEAYRNAHIVYGQGDFIFDRPNPGQKLYEGFLVKLRIGNNFGSEMEIVPYCQSDDGVGVRRLEGQHEALFLQSITRRSADILKEEFVQKEWLRFCEERRYGYLSTLMGYNRILHRLNSNGHLVKHRRAKKLLTKIQNVICCEAHREVLETVFDRRLI